MITNTMDIINLFVICERRYSNILTIRALFWSNPCGFAVINANAFIKVREHSKTYFSNFEWRQTHFLIRKSLKNWKH